VRGRNEDELKGLEIITFSWS